MTGSTRRQWILAGASAALLQGCATRRLPPAPGDWQHFQLPGKAATQYRWSSKEGVPCWHATANRSASMWRRQLHVPADRLGEVEFSWWVPHIVEGADVRQADTEDAPARMIFAFEGDESRLSLRNRMLFEMARSLTGEAPPYATLMYVWANHLAPDDMVINPRIDRIRKIVVESGSGNLKRWRHYRRDLREDFRRAFGEEPGALVGIALMTDADNTGTHAEAWYGDIRVQGVPRDGA